MEKGRHGGAVFTQIGAGLFGPVLRRAGMGMTQLLQRMVKRAPDPVDPVPILRRAVRRAADRELGIDLRVDDCAAGDLDLAQSVGGIEPDDLVIALDRGGQMAGFVVIPMVLWSAVVELQTVGAIFHTAGAGRAPTGTDAALCSPFLTRLLDELSATSGGAVFETWYAGIKLGARLRVLRLIELTLPSGLYHEAAFTLHLPEQTDTQPLHLRLITRPAEPPAPSAPPARGGGQVAAALGAPVKLEAILHRFELPLSVLKTLEPGTTVPLDGATVGSLHLEASDRRPVCAARLGRIGAYRALRLEQPDAAAMDDLALGAPAMSDMGLDLGGPALGAPDIGFDGACSAPDGAEDGGALVLAGGVEHALGMDLGPDAPPDALAFEEAPETPETAAESDPAGISLDLSPDPLDMPALDDLPQIDLGDFE